MDRDYQQQVRTEALRRRMAEASDRILRRHVDVRRLAQELCAEVDAMQCLVARYGEMTLECSVEDPCETCAARRTAASLLRRMEAL